MSLGSGSQASETQAGLSVALSVSLKWSPIKSLETGSSWVEEAEPDSDPSQLSSPVSRKTLTPEDQVGVG